MLTTINTTVKWLCLYIHISTNSYYPITSRLHRSRYMSTTEYGMETLAFSDHEHVASEVRKPEIVLNL